MKIFITTLLLLSMVLGAQGQIPTNGLIGYWPFNSNSNDESGNSNNGIISNTVSANDRFGNMNRAYSFSGSQSSGISSSVTILNAPTLNTETWSVSAWYKTTAQGYNRVTTKQAGQFSSNCFGIIMLNGKIYGSAWDGTTEVTVTDSSLTNDGNWHHVVFMRDKVNQKLYLYVNSILKDTASETLGNLINGENLIIGSTSTWQQHNQTWNGSLDDIRIYNRILDTTEIKALHQETVCTTTVLVAVTDTLIIDANLTGIAPPQNHNTLRIYPNPAKTHITIDNGNLASMTGYKIKITNSLGQEVFQSSVNQHLFNVNLSSWSGLGIYYVHVIDGQGNAIEIKKIILQ